MLDLFEFPCLNCGGVLKLDLYRTCESYEKEISLLYESVTLNDSDKDLTIPDYFWFRCLACGYTKKYSIKEVLFLLRDLILEKAIAAKIKAYTIANLLPSDLNDSKWIICGLCDGIDGEGACPQSFFNRCLIRKMKETNSHV